VRPGGIVGQLATVRSTSEPVDDADAQAPNAIEDATATFADRTRAQYSTVEMLPDGTLKASLRFPIFDDQRSYDVEVTDVAYYSPNTWLSVQPPPCRSSAG
jgi:hypothetical protein